MKNLLEDFYDVSEIISTFLYIYLLSYQMDYPHLVQDD